jgi:hypothetical protein
VAILYLDSTFLEVKSAAMNLSQSYAEPSVEHKIGAMNNSGTSSKLSRSSKVSVSMRLPDPKWVEKFRTELSIGTQDPIFHDTYIFSAPQFQLVKVKVELYHQYGIKKNLHNRKAKSEMTLVGEGVFSIDELIKSSMSLTKSAITNSQNKRLEQRMSDYGIGSRIVLRYEDVEQTNEQVTFQFRAMEFEVKSAIMYKLLRNRSLGEFVLVHTSEKRRNNRKAGTLFDEVELPVKEIVRNDLDRLMRLEVYQCRKRGPDVLLGETDFSINQIKKSKSRAFSSYSMKNLVGKLHVVTLKEWNAYQFIDYIHGGMTVSLYLAIDFSLGNKDFNDPFSLHYINDKMEEEESSDEGEESQLVGKRKKKKSWQHLQAEEAE